MQEYLERLCDENPDGIVVGIKFSHDQGVAVGRLKRSGEIDGGFELIARMGAAKMEPEYGTSMGGADGQAIPVLMEMRHIFRASEVLRVVFFEEVEMSPRGALEGLRRAAAGSPGLADRVRRRESGLERGCQAANGERVRASLLGQCRKRTDSVLKRTKRSH